MRSKTLAYVCLAVVTLVATPLRADWINLTGAETSPNIAEIYVLDDRVHVKLEVFVGDLDKFADLVPDDLLRDAGGRESLDEWLERFRTASARNGAWQVAWRSPRQFRFGDS